MLTPSFSAAMSAVCAGKRGPPVRRVAGLEERGSPLPDSAEGCVAVREGLGTRVCAGTRGERSQAGT